MTTVEVFYIEGEVNGAQVKEAFKNKIFELFNIEPDGGYSKADTIKAFWDSISGEINQKYIVLVEKLTDKGMVKAKEFTDAVVQNIKNLKPYADEDFKVSVVQPGAIKTYLSNLISEKVKAIVLKDPTVTAVNESVKSYSDEISKFIRQFFEKMGTKYEQTQSLLLILIFTFLIGIVLLSSQGINGNRGVVGFSLIMLIFLIVAICFAI